MIREMSLSFSEGADKVAIEHIIVVHRAVIVKRRTYVDAWVVKVPSDQCMDFMTVMDNRHDVVATYCDFPVNPCNSVSPTDYLYTESQQAIYAFLDVQEGWELVGSRAVNGPIILDTGVISHPDLPEVIQVFIPGIYSVSKFHGTMVASAFAKETGTGIVGIAPNCEQLISICAPNNVTIAGLADMFELVLANDYKASGHNVINFSWGVHTTPESVSIRVGNAIAIEGNFGNTYCGLPIYIETAANKYYGTIDNGFIFEDPYDEPEFYKTVYTVTWEGTAPTVGTGKFIILNKDIYDIVKTVSDNDYLVCIAAGNSYTQWNALQSPHALNVSSWGGLGLAVQPHASRGMYVDVVAPSEQILAVFPTNEITPSSFYIRLSATLTEGSKTVSASEIYDGAAGLFGTFPSVSFGLSAGSQYFANGTMACPLSIINSNPNYTIQMSTPSLISGTVELTFRMYYGYAFGTGTSYATPNAVAVACTVRSLAPYLTNQQTKDIIKTTATSIAGASLIAGSGLVNLYQAVLSADMTAGITTPALNLNLSANIPSVALTVIATTPSADISLAGEVPTIGISIAVSLLTAEMVTVSDIPSISVIRTTSGNTIRAPSGEVYVGIWNGTQLQPVTIIHI